MFRSGPLPLGHAAFLCPECGHPSVQVCCSVAVGADPDHQSNRLEAISCTACSFVGAAASRVAGNGRTVLHGGCALDPAAFQELISLIDGCGTPEDPTCTCLIHAELGRRRDGRWPGLSLVGNVEVALQPVQPPRADVLIVDDDDDLRTQLALLLEDSGYVVARARSAQEALDYLRRHEPPLAMVLDLMMPGMSGLRLREELAADRRLRDVQVFFFTAAGDRHLELVGLPAGEVLRKPTGLNTLICRIESAVGARA
jgi:CheY-like chemotaxis protein